MKRAARRPAGPLVGLIGALAAACATPGFLPYEEQPGPYDQLSPLQLEALVESRRLLGEDLLEPARRRLSSLSAAAPDNLAVATLLQEAELDLLAQGLSVPGVAAGQEGLAPSERLLPIYAARAQREGSAAACVLAARVSNDPSEAEAWLASALEADPECVWAHYALAWTHAGARRYEEAQQALARALALDPGHPPARRLEAAMLARSGDVERAVIAHELWLERYATDARVAPRRVVEAWLDLAALRVLASDPAAALSALDELDSRHLSDPVAATLTRASALDMLERPAEALEEVQRAVAANPHDLRPRLQEALLLVERFGDSPGARAVWEEVLRMLDEPSVQSSLSADPAAEELGTLFVRLQALATIARLEAYEASATGNSER